MKKINIVFLTAMIVLALLAFMPAVNAQETGDEIEEGLIMVEEFDEEIMEAVDEELEEAMEEELEEIMEVMEEEEQDIMEALSLPEEDEEEFEIEEEEIEEEFEEEEITELEKHPRLLHRLWKKIKFLQERIRHLEKRVMRLEALLLPTLAEKPFKKIKKEVAKKARGKLAVNVVRPEGQVVEGARVIVSPLGVGVKQKIFTAEKTDDEGTAVMRVLPGRYVVRAEALVDGEYFSSGREVVWVKPNELVELTLRLGIELLEEPREEELIEPFARVGEEEVTGITETSVDVDGTTLQIEKPGDKFKVKGKKLFWVQKKQGKIIAKQVKVPPKKLLIKQLMKRMDISREEAEELIKKWRDIRLDMVEENGKVKINWKAKAPNVTPIWNIFVPEVTEEGTIEVPTEEITEEATVTE